MSTAHAHMTDAQLDSLAAAHTRSVDALAGFDTMVEKAEPEFRDVAIRFRDLHRRHAAELGAILEENGRKRDEDGSFMATVNTLVVSTRALFDEIDEDVMDQVRDGERHVMKALDDAQASVSEPLVKNVVKQMRSDLAALLDETRHLD